MTTLPAARAGFFFRLLPAVLWLLLAPAALAGNPHPDFEVNVSGQGKPLIFIPGLGTPGALWQPVVDQLRGAYQCHVITPAGFGQVKPTGSDPFLPRVRDELIDYIRSEKLDHPIIIGHSLGGVLALWIAETAPELPGGLVIVDALPFQPAMLVPSATAGTMRAQIAPMIAQMADASAEQFAELEKQTISALVTSPEDVRRVLALNAGSDPKTIARALGESMTTDLRPDLGKISCPTLVLISLADKVPRMPKEMVLANFRAQYAGLRGVRFQTFDAAKHFIMLDDPPAFMRALQGELTAGPAK